MANIGLIDSIISRSVLEDVCGSVTNFTIAEGVALYYGSYSTQLHSNNPLMVECGSFRGGSGIIMATALRDAVNFRLCNPITWCAPDDTISGKCILIDINEEFLNLARKNIAEYRLHNIVETRLGSDIQYASEFLPDSISLLHIDTFHGYEQTIEELSTYFPLVKRGGIIFAHDYGFLERDVIKAVDEFSNDVNMDGCHVVDRLWWGIKR